MRLPPFFWPLTLLVLASADCGMVTGHPPYGIFNLLLPALVAVAAAVAFVLGQSGAAGRGGAAVVALFAALAGFALGFLLPLSLLFVVLVALLLAGMAASTIWIKSKGADK